jgi:peptidoglycan L-alanyl-D-glutamate endopeptidase CwlK
VIRGHSYYAISGFRDPIEQDKLYAIGRTEKKGSPIVTNAPGFKSYHNYGLAIDFCWDKDQKREGLQPGWDVKSYMVLAEEAEKLGLVSGMKFKMVDAPHIQIPMNVIGLTKLEEIYKEGGIEACWEEVTKVLSTSNAFKKSWGASDTPDKS